MTDIKQEVRTAVETAVGVLSTLVGFKDGAVDDITTAVLDTIEAAISDELATGLAEVIAGPAWEIYSARGSAVADARRGLLWLAAAGRLVPEGAQVITAEQWETLGPLINRALDQEVAADRQRATHPDDVVDAEVYGWCDNGDVLITGDQAAKLRLAYEAAKGSMMVTDFVDIANLMSAVSDLLVDLFPATQAEQWATWQEVPPNVPYTTKSNPDRKYPWINHGGRRLIINGIHLVESTLGDEHMEKLGPFIRAEAGGQA